MPAGALEPADELVEQPRLADAGIAGDEEDAAAAVRRALVGAAQPPQLGLASAQRGEAAHPRDFEPRAAADLAGDGVGAHGLALALDRELAEVLQEKEAVGEPVRLHGGHDLARLRQIEHARGQVRRVADGGVVHPEVAANGAHDDEAGVDPDTDAELHTVRAPHVSAQGVETLLDRQGGAERALSVVLVGDGGAEERHHAVAEELVDRSLVAVDGLENDLEGAVHDRVDFFGIQALGHRREAGDVGEEHRHLLALAFDGAARAEDLVGEVLRRVRLR